MKKNKRTLVAAAVVATAFLAIGCGTTAKAIPSEVANSPSSKATAPADVDETDKIVIADWCDRALGEVAAPAWLKMIRKGNATAFKQQYGLAAGRIVKSSVGTGSSELGARTDATLNSAVDLGRELRMSLNAKMGRTMLSDETKKLVNDAALQIKVEIPSMRTEAGFWQKIRRTAYDTGMETEEYYYYDIYSIDSELWDAIVLQYVRDTIKGIDFTPQEKTVVAGLLAEMQNEKDRANEQEQAEREMLIRLEAERLRTERAMYEAAAAQQPTAELTVAEAEALLFQ